MAFDYKKGYKEFYLPLKQPGIVGIPGMSFLVVRGRGDPNEENEGYKRAMELFYGIAYTIKISCKGEHVVEGFFEYVVPPLEGLWRQEGIRGADYSRKDLFQRISLIRLLDFVKENNSEWALGEATRKREMDLSQVEFLPYDEGLYVQYMRLGSYNSEPATIRQAETYTQEHGYTINITDKRHHHGIYLGDPRRTEAVKLKTVIRHPVRKV